MVPYLGEESRKLLSAIQKNDVSEIEKLLEDFKAQGRISDILNYQIEESGIKVIHVATVYHNLEAVRLFLQYGCHPDVADRYGRTSLHIAADLGSSDIIRLLLQNGASVNVISKREEICFVDWNPNANYGKTPLHLATSGLHYECVKILLENHADVDVLDDDGRTALLTTGEKLKSDVTTELITEYEKITELLLQFNAKVNVFSMLENKGAMYQAIQFNSLKVCKNLMSLGYDGSIADRNGDTVLHEASKNGVPDFVTEIVKAYPKLVNVSNERGETPLHYAAFSGSRACLSILLNEGGDMSKRTTSGLSVSDVIFESIPRPVNFLVKIFDSKLIPNDYSINDKRFNVTLDFRILAPNDDSQMSVVIALIKSLTTEQKSKILVHPLIETFIKLKWRRLRILFFLLVLIHFFFVLSLSMYVGFLIDNGSSELLTISRAILLTTGCVIFFHHATQITLAPKYFLKEYETWLSVLCIGLSLTMGVVEGYILRSADPLPEWIRHVAAYDVLLSWTLLMFVLGRFPMIGYFALMFFTVLKNVMKVLLFFACLVIGFSLSFCVQYNDMQFKDPWKAFVRTTVMLMGEFEYTELFDENKIVNRFLGVSNALFITSRVIFLLFVLLGGIVLMNLMTGLAVYDIQGLQAEGNVRHVTKQAEFISHIEKILSRRLPQKLKKYFGKKKFLPNLVTLKPSADKISDLKDRHRVNHVPLNKMEAIVLTSVKNQKSRFQNQDSMSDDIDLNGKHNQEWLNNALGDMKNELQLLSRKLDDVLIKSGIDKTE